MSHSCFSLAQLNSAGLVGQLEMSTFSILSKLQENMASAIKSIGNIEHEVYPPSTTAAPPLI